MTIQIFQAQLKRRKISNYYELFIFSFCLVLSCGKGKSLLIDNLSKIVGRGGFAGAMQMQCHRLETRVTTACLNEDREEDGGVVYLVLTAMHLA